MKIVIIFLSVLMFSSCSEPTKSSPVQNIDLLNQSNVILYYDVLGLNSSYYVDVIPIGLKEISKLPLIKVGEKVVYKKVSEYEEQGGIAIITHQDTTIDGKEYLKCRCIKNISIDELRNNPQVILE